MEKTSTPYREFCRKQHRIVGAFLAVQSWVRRIDCIIVDREELIKFLGIEKFEESRFDWIKEDLKQWFPFQECWKSKGVFGWIILSRFSFKEIDTDFTLTINKIVTIYNKSGLRCGRYDFVVKKGSSTRILAPTEKEMISYLALLSSGTEIPRANFKKRIKKTNSLIQV